MQIKNRTNWAPGESCCSWEGRKRTWYHMCAAAAAVLATETIWKHSTESLTTLDAGRTITVALNFLLIHLFTLTTCNSKTCGHHWLQINWCTCLCSVLIDGMWVNTAVKDESKVCLWWLKLLGGLIFCSLRSIPLQFLFIWFNSPPAWVRKGEEEAYHQGAGMKGDETDPHTLTPIMFIEVKSTLEMEESISVTQRHIEELQWEFRILWLLEIAGNLKVAVDRQFFQVQVTSSRDYKKIHHFYSWWQSTSGALHREVEIANFYYEHSVWIQWFGPRPAHLSFCENWEKKKMTRWARIKWEEDGNSRKQKQPLPSLIKPNGLKIFLLQCSHNYVHIVVAQAKGWLMWVHEVRFRR